MTLQRCLGLETDQEVWWVDSTDKICRLFWSHRSWAAGDSELNPVAQAAYSAPSDCCRHFNFQRNAKEWLARATGMADVKKLQLPSSLMSFPINSPKWSLTITDFAVIADDRRFDHRHLCSYYFLLLMNKWINLIYSCDYNLLTCVQWILLI